MYKMFGLPAVSAIHGMISAQFVFNKFGSPPYPENVLRVIEDDFVSMQLAYSEMLRSSHKIVGCPPDIAWWPTGLIGEFFSPCSGLVYRRNSRASVLTAILQRIPQVTPFWSGFNELRFVGMFAIWVRSDCPIADLDRGPGHVTVSTVLSAMCRRFASDCFPDLIHELFCDMLDIGLADVPADTAPHGGQTADTAPYGGQPHWCD